MNHVGLSVDVLSSLYAGCILHMARVPRKRSVKQTTAMANVGGFKPVKLHTSHLDDADSGLQEHHPKLWANQPTHPPPNVTLPQK